jgi:hypothetical protein
MKRREVQLRSVQIATRVVHGPGTKVGEHVNEWRLLRSFETEFEQRLKKTSTASTGGMHRRRRTREASVVTKRTEVRGPEQDFVEGVQGHGARDNELTERPVAIEDSQAQRISVHEPPASSVEPTGKEREQLVLLVRVLIRAP